MMRLIHHFILFFSISLLLPGNVYALDALNHSGNVLKFQQKLAMNGNASAQYKLATMYESGTGVEENIEQAKSWYERASAAGNKAAKDRMVYLSIKEQGYDQAKNSAWLNGIKKDANASKGNEIFLLAQLYRQGLGVKKDLNKSLEMLDQVSLLGAADVENEMALLLAEMDKNNKAKEMAKKKNETDIARLAQKEKEQKEKQQVKKKQQVIKQAEAENARQSEKIRRYEKAMMQLKLEQQQIDRQQTWASGDDADTIEAEDEI